MNLNKYVRTEKNYLKLVDRYNKLTEARRKRPSRELKEPYQDGWFVEARLRPGLVHKKEALRWQRMIPYVTHRIVCRNPALISQIRRTNTFYDVEAMFTTRNGREGPAMVRFYDHNFKRIPEEFKQYFATFEENGKFGRVIRYYSDITKDMLIIKPVKRFITHIQDLDPLMESEIKQIDLQLENYWRTLPGYYKDPNEDKSVARKHMKSNIKKFLKAEVSDPSYFRKYKV